MEAFAMKAPVPVLRIFDEGRAREFYIDFLGFHLDWEHRYRENFPVYAQISRGPCIIHLSEHHGDGSPGALIRIETEGLEDFQKLLIEKNYKYAKPGLEIMPYGTRAMSVADPFGNRLVFFDRTA
jgi:catechol 2,3-dioxygenase-like lactoylglutathione lyase family enzyme